MVSIDKSSPRDPTNIGSTTSESKISCEGVWKVFGNNAEDFPYDCGKPRGWIKKVGWKAGNDKWPCAYQAVRSFKIDNQSMGEMIGKVDLEGNKVDSVVDNWIKTNKGTWKKWTQCS